MPPSDLVAAPPAPVAPPARAPGSARERLILGAARIFAERGYEGASTRAICQAAGANVAAIHYHFGDKAGLYRAVIWTSIECVVAALPTHETSAELPLEEAMDQLLRAFLGPVMGADEVSLWFSRIHQRETIEPTPMMQDVIATSVLPHFQGLVALLARHCGAAGPDDELHRLAFAISALVNDYCLSRHWMQALAPGLLAGPDAMDRAVVQLRGYACALVRAEAERRRRQE